MVSSFIQVSFRDLWISICADQYCTDTKSRLAAAFSRLRHRYHSSSFSLFISFVFQPLKFLEEKEGKGTLLSERSVLALTFQVRLATLFPSKNLRVPYPTSGFSAVDMWINLGITARLLLCACGAQKQSKNFFSATSPDLSNEKQKK